MKNELFTFQKANISIGNKSILTSISLNIYEDEHVIVSGRNGSGKTTLCKAIAGRARATKGYFKVKNIDFQDVSYVSFSDDGKLFHSVNNVHYYQQRFNSWDSDGFMTARAYLESKGISVANESEDHFLESIGLKNLLDFERIKLSSGQTRKLLLASALLKYPKLLIIDNPYIGLDVKSRSVFNDFLDQIVRDRKVTIVLSGQYHDLPKCIKRKVILHDGKMVESEDMSGEKSKNFDVILSKVKKFKYSKTCPLDIQKGKELVQFQDTTISYRGIPVLSGLNWTVKAGERWLLSGENGSGKSTIVSMIYGDHPQIYSQQLTMFGKRYGTGRSIWEVKSQIGFTSPELHAYFKSTLTAQEVVWTGLFDKFEIMSNVDCETKSFTKLLFEYYHLTSIMKTPFDKLCTGHQRICLFIRALIKQPTILLLDEPFQGLDSHHIERSKRLLDTILSPRQALIFISHLNHETPSSINHFKNLGC